MLMPMLVKVRNQKIEVRLLDKSSTSGIAKLFPKEYGKAQKMIDSLPEQQADKKILNARLLLA